jgi:glycosyltransferase involved in cell wall biosynthesis
MSARTTASGRTRPLEHVRDAALFIVWGSPGNGPRSRVFARELGIEVVFVRSWQRRGLLTAPFRYVSQAAKTRRLLHERRPRVVFVQSPPTFAVMTVLRYSRATGARCIVDAHSDALLSPWWTRPRWRFRRLAREAAATIVTNEHSAQVIRDQGGVALVIRDIPTSFPPGTVDLSGAFSVMVVSSFAPDEPLREILDAARGLPDVSFFVTGDRARAPRDLLSELPKNVRFTGFLPDGDYFALMRSCAAVLCLTTRDHTMQRGACEALWMGRPVVTSDWPLLRDYFSSGAVFVDGSAGSIGSGIADMVSGHGRYLEGIDRLRTERAREWQDVVPALVAIADGPPGGVGCEDGTRGARQR